MLSISETIDLIREFLDAGGVVLNYIGILIFVMWMLILERVFYVTHTYKVEKKAIIAQWKGRAERESWNAIQIRDAIISRAKMSLNRSLSTIQAFVALCPLLGLLGTVTGMIEVFDVMATSGSGNARSMASGVSKATIPTMAGMVGALSGVFASTWLKRTAKTETELLEDKLTLDH
ncbi:MotA/TolQ/ExbB proton channel family protein [Aliikangiella marina]|uniref:MotA/TolQ/ExbB proton channel family protein n=1 Tax=Aliikangiella marina TaxID=1712262 RepID=A0A545T4L6_9GAMM|nr:MotA/TolQ/ExbB proton channel family protein [Aliikangiella marina]TQV72163.1 MotA/TolQ/ExbB proton channel family protein [Aliikangiella marina]